MTRGRIFIIASDYVLNTNSALITAREKASMTQSGTYNNYWSSAPSFTGIRDSILTLFKEKTYTLNSNYDSSKCVTALLNTTNWASFLDTGTGYGQYAIGGPTLEMWCDSWTAYLRAHPNSAFKEMTAGGKNFHGYYVTSGTTKDQDWLCMNGTQESLTSDQRETLQSSYSLFFPHTSYYNNCSGYWLASPSAHLSSWVLIVGVPGDVQGIKYDSHYFGLRPLVCLNPEILGAKEADEVWQLSKSADI